MGGGTQGSGNEPREELEEVLTDINSNKARFHVRQALQLMYEDGSK
jgi:hypothetical protein